MEEKINTIQSLIGVLNTPIAQRKGVILSPEHCKIWVEELSKFMQEHGWHPASELPKESGIYVVITDFYSCQTAVFAKYDKDKGWDTTDIDNIEWWCYLPKED